MNAYDPTKRTARLIMTGTWLYDNIKPMTVQIFAINWDYSFEFDQGYNDENDKPELNQKMEQYVIVWGEGDFFEQGDSPDYGGLTLKEAIESAENIVKGIQWESQIAD